MGIEFRDMEIDDVAMVYEIEKKSFATPWTKQSLMTEISENKLARYKLMCKDSEIIGYFGVWIVDDEAHIMNIAIKPEYRRQGYGDLLFQELLNTAENEDVKRVTLEVRKSNEAAINLYEKHGFEACAIRKDYYRDLGEDAYIMWLEIEDNY